MITKDQLFDLTKKYKINEMTIHFVSFSEREKLADFFDYLVDFLKKQKI